MFADHFPRILSAVSLPLLRLLLLTIVQDVEDFSLRHPLSESYDLIVVGSGSAGSVIAARLSEIWGLNVLLLEAGGPPPIETYLPSMMPLNVLPGNTAAWNYETVPQKHALMGFKNRQARLIQGNTLGGTSTINGLLYVRGSRQDYDNWANLGNDGWDYQSILQYFQKIERYRGSPNNDQYLNYGKSGQISITPMEDGPFTEALLKGGQELGFPALEDINGLQNLGFSKMFLNIGDGRRVSTAEGYLRPALERPNLHVLHSATVEQILFDGHKKAVGVKFIHHGKTLTVRIRREIILSAGAIASPKLLLTSGVGPRKHLEAHHIKVVADVPGVGLNFDDHPGVLGVCWHVKRGTIPSLIQELNPGSFLQYKSSRTGRLAEYIGETPNGWINVGGGDDPLWPDIQIFANPILPSSDFGFFYPSVYNMKRETYSEHFKGFFGQEGFCLQPILVRPKSKGRVRLKSKDASTPPLIDPNYLSHPDDVWNLVKAIKVSLALGNTSTFVHEFGAKFHDQPLRECTHKQPYSDAYWACYVRHMTATTFHYAGSCKMAPLSDPFGVVDQRLRVRGVHRLRVADASIMPQVTSGNTNAPVMVIGEKAADMIKADWALG